MATVKPGERAPDFALPTDTGETIRLADLRGRFVVLFFFVKANTPGWITEASEFRDAKAKFDRRNAVILGCSGDRPELLARFREKQRLNFPLLSDPEFKVIEAYGARRWKKFLGKTFLGIIRSTVLIGPDGRIARVWEKAPAKGHAAQVLTALDELA